MLLKYTEIKKQNVKLENEKGDLSDKVQELEAEVKHLKQRVEVVDVIKGIDLQDDSSISFARTRVNHLIRDIDKCISLLND